MMPRKANTIIVTGLLGQPWDQAVAEVLLGGQKL